MAITKQDALDYHTLGGRPEAGGEESRQAQFNLEVRVCDAAASPYLALGALVFAGADGVARQMEIPETETALPTSLNAALDLMDASTAMKTWFGPVFFEAYMRHKRSEVVYVAELSETELCARYAQIY